MSPFVAPAPDDGEAVQALRSLLHPYLTLLALDNPWDFFTPNINTGHRLRYIVEAADGTSHAFVPLDELNWYFPYFMWMGQWQDAIVDAPEIHADPAAALFCREHASLQPIAVTITQVEQNEVGSEDYLTGKHPFDPGFATRNHPDACPVPGAVTFTDGTRQVLAALADAWSRLWFQNRSTVPLELSRIGIGAALLLNYGLATLYVLDFWGESAWMPQATVFQLADDPWMQSVFYYLTSSWQLIACHSLFLLCCTAFMVGWRTSWVKWIVSSAKSHTTVATPFLPMGSIRFSVRCFSSFVSRRSDAR